ncbi:hypothetical protein QR78_25560 [Methylobacterium indicum]|uniref:Conjugal transfer protein TraC n=2 Tax=Methylobacterium indicum TaxID=1775910 RepID=A0ABR5H2S5_9HYPH|nr:TraC family protein [Methylobacterium indicum]KMO13258.1 hypothetical protein QR78_25560 [Methylobacterium indicum]KMO17757.1 hypothetical protein QR79_21345 [Methylobacterium indicum]
MARVKSRAALLAEIEEATKRLKAHDKAEAERIGHLALKAGLASISMAEEVLLKAFEELAARFQAEYPAVAEPKTKGRRSAGPAQAGADGQAE